MNVKKLLVLLVPAAALLLGAACGGASSAAQSRTSTATGSNFTAPAGQAPAGQAGAAQPARGDVLPPQPGPTLPEGPRVQRTASLTLEVANGRFDASLDRVIALMRNEGGYISGSQADADDARRLRSGQVTFQVPASKFDDVLAGLKRLGTAQSIRIGGNDVSLQYVDLQARLRNTQAQEDAMRALLQQARSVNEIIQIQNQLGQITGQKEQIEGQLAFLDHSTTYATVTVTIREAAASASSDEWGLATAGSQALHNFVNTVNVVLVVLGAVTPLLVVGLGAGLVGWRVRQRMRQSKTAPSLSGRASTE
jgi:hypothetical protein